MQSEKFVEETFAGSLPKFLTAFTKRKKLSEKEIAQLQKIIAENQSKGADKSIDEGTEINITNQE